MKAARVRGLNRHRAERISQIIRQALAWDCERGSPLRGEVDADKSSFGGPRTGPRGRGAAGSVAVFGLLKRRGKVYPRPVPAGTRAPRRAVIPQKVPTGSTISSDQLAVYEADDPGLAAGPHEPPHGGRHQAAAQQRHREFLGLYQDHAQAILG